MGVQIRLQSLVVVLLVVACHSSLTYSAPFDSPSCPKPLDIQTDYVKSNFNLTKFQGVWYELAYHDYTQPIGLCGCERSVKHFHPDTNYIFDNFTLFCGGATQFNNLTYNLTGYTRGHMVGHWPLLSDVDFPNTVVALGVNKTGEYNWVIEFQCVEILGKVVFTGINFYNRERFVPKSELQTMMDTARKQGLGYWMDNGLKVHVVDHTNCTYAPVSQSYQHRPHIKPQLANHINTDNYL